MYYKALDHDKLPPKCDKQLMKIDRASFGLGGYQGAQFGLTLDFSSRGSGVSAFICGGWGYDISPEGAKWSEEDRKEGMAEMCQTVFQILSAARVDTVDRLKGIPVEVVFERMSIVSFRILEEVL